MSSLIKILPDNLINKIAAGEVVERPASVVKELVENAVDAGATEILIDIEQSGRRLIRVTDNGSGMSRDDARLCFERHATSKISEEADLDAIRTMGFRGEALSSIAAVSQVRLLTALSGAETGVLVEIEGGRLKPASDSAAPRGTAIEVGHLFYNTPARLKFLKSPATEFSHILAAVARQAMAHSKIRFKLTHNKKQALDILPSSSIKERVYQLYGADLSGNLMEFSGGRDGVGISGLLSRPAYTRGDRTYQDFYVNHRHVKSPSLNHALYSAYGDMLMRDRHPACFIFIELDPALVDVNVHPAKAEVRFRNQTQIHDLARDVIREGLRGVHGASSETSTDRVKEAIADYLGSAESGAASSEFRVRSSEVNFEKADAAGLSPSFHSAIGTQHSAPLFPLAQVHDSFIIAQSNEGMAIIDQHAAHERVLFERLQDQFAAGNIPVQNLLLPAQVELGPADREALLEHLPEFDRLGFAVEDFGGGAFIIKAVPALLAGADYKQLLHDMLDEITAHGRSGRLDALRDGILSTMACHPAIKVHRSLDQREMETLILDLFSCRMPHTCPHGRPTVVRFSTDEIKKMFKRM